MDNPIDIAIQKFGSLANMARQLDVTRQAIEGWRKHGKVPPPHCPRIERALNGAMRCEQLNGDVDWGYIRDSAKTQF